MEQNDFYEVGWSMDFIPVTIVGISEDGVIVTPTNDKRNCQLEVKEVYRLPKPQDPQKVVVPRFVNDWLKKYRYAHTLLRVLNAAEKEQIVPSTVNEWILDNQYDFIKAWIDGWDIELEETDE
jgi:hypothetical protein